MLGTVARLRRYPVKSMLGEDLEVGDVGRAGLAGDRRLAVVSRRTGKVASAKYPRLWRDLLTLSAQAVDGAARITLPDGKTVCSTDADVDEVLSALLNQPVTLTATPPPGATLDRAVPEAVLRNGIRAEVPAELIEIGAGAPPGTDAALSEFLGQPVTLAAVPPPDATLDRAVPEEVLRDGVQAPVSVEVSHIGGASGGSNFVDFAPLHLLTTATLDRIAELSPYRRSHLERYRPNVVIRTEPAGFAENDWLGREVHIGDEVVLRVIARTPRCAVPTLAHGGLPRDAEALRVLARHNRVRAFPDSDPEPCAGVYAAVLRPGRIRPGDEVRLAGQEGAS
jgi:uncharacterized protein